MALQKLPHRHRLRNDDKQNVKKERSNKFVTCWTIVYVYVSVGVNFIFLFVQFDRKGALLFDNNKMFSPDPTHAQLSVSSAKVSS